AHELFGEDFGAFQLRGEAGGAEDRQSALLELVDDAEGQGQLGADDGEVHLQLFGEIGQLDDVGHADADAVRDPSDAGIAGRRVELFYEGRLAELPGERMLACPLPDDQYTHRFVRSRWILKCSGSFVIVKVLSSEC